MRRCGAACIPLLAWLLACCVCASTASTLPRKVAARRSTQAQHQLPRDIAQWTYGLDLEQLRQKTYHKEQPHRFWNRAALQRALVVDNARQLQPFLQRLDAGLPVTVVAIGDSVIHSWGGCFHQSVQQVSNRLHNLPPVYVEETCERRPQPRWLEGFMQVVNETWPHPDHLLINLGRTASNFKTHSMNDCMEALLPERIDLLIADHLSYPQEGAQPAIYAEALLNRVQLHLNGPLPPTIILNVLPILNHMRYPNELRELFDHRMSCIMNPSICRATCPTDFVGVPIPEDVTSDAESKTAAVARFYGATMFSQAFNLHNMILDQVHVALNMTECELFGLMYEDSVHPSATGRLYLADLLTNHLVKAQEQQVAAALQAPVVGMSGLAVQEPLQLMHNVSATLPWMKCWARPEAQPTAQSMQVLEANGFSWTEMDGGRHRPGWVATSVGATLKVRLPTAWLDQPRTHWFHISLLHLKSYEHMGMAQVTCVAGCRCEGVSIFDGHTGIHASYPWPVKIPAVLLDDADGVEGFCVVQLKVLDETQAPDHQHKVKVLQLVVSVEQDRSQELLELRHRLAQQRH